MTALERFDSFLASVAHRRVSILVIGDRIADYYVSGTLTRIAPEGGAPVFEESHREIVDGGAGNVAAQLEAWNVDAVLVADGSHIKTRYLVDGKLHAVLSFTKFREHDRLYNLSHLPGMIVDRAWDAVVVADYAKGMVTPKIAVDIVQFCRELSIPLIVDPSPVPAEDRDYRWQGATVLKMNRKQWQTRGQENVSHWLEDRRIDNLIITNGPDSPRLVSRDPHWESSWYPQRHSRLPVVDAAGAGDHFAAVLAVGMAHGLPVDLASEYAHEASKIRVAYRRPRPILPAEVRGQFDRPMGKVLRACDVATILKHKPGRVVFTNGCFGLVHAGHANMLDWSRDQGDILIVGVNDDESTARLRQTRPLMPLAQRARLLASLSSVDFVVPFAEDTPCDTLKTLNTARRVNLLTKGDDYRGTEVPGSDLVDEVRFAPTVFTEHATDWVRLASERLASELAG